MAAETGAGIAAWKFGLIGKGVAMFAASAIGAAIMAVYHPATRKATWWQAMGAGFGGVVFGPLVLKALASWADLFKPTADPWDWLSIALPVLFMFGGIFWGLVGALLQLRQRIEAKGGNAIADKVGL